MSYRYRIVNAQGASCCAGDEPRNFCDRCQAAVRAQLTEHVNELLGAPAPLPPRLVDGIRAAAQPQPSRFLTYLNRPRPLAPETPSPRAAGQHEHDDVPAPPSLVDRIRAANGGAR